MKDACGRTINYLRVSVTDRCNLRCCYCMPCQGIASIPHDQVLSLEEIKRICAIMAALGISKIKITGGEPLVRKGVVGLIGEIKQLPNIEQVTLTTNALSLAQHLPELCRHHLDGINISLDTLDQETYQQLTRCDGLDAALSALDQAITSGIPIKINCVPIKGVNDKELVNMARFAQEKVTAVRFIELMPMGLAAGFEGVAMQTIKAALEQEFGPLISSNVRIGNGPAKYYSINHFAGKIGFIDAISHCFCDQCNRLRLTADGKLKLCLAQDAYLDIKTPLRAGANDAELSKLIAAAINSKPLHHDFALQPTKTEKSNMFSIGG